MKNALDKIEVLENGAMKTTRLYDESTIYAIRSKRNGKYVTGTDFRVFPTRQILYEGRPPLIFNGIMISCEVKRRRINLKYYEIVPVDIVVNEEKYKTMPMEREERE